MSHSFGCETAINVECLLPGKCLSMYLVMTHLQLSSKTQGITNAEPVFGFLFLVTENFCASIKINPRNMSALFRSAGSWVPQVPRRIQFASCGFIHPLLFLFDLQQLETLI